MTKKKITTGNSSQNGQKILLAKYKIALKAKDKKALQEIDSLFNSEEETTYIFFKKPLWPARVLGGSEEDWKKYCEAKQLEHEENIVKLQLLCDHYGIESDQFKYLNLSLSLARELYPEPAKRGRANKWTDEIIGILIVEMQNLMDSNAGVSNKGVNWAANQLANNPDWQLFLEKKESENTTHNPTETLRAQYERCFRKIDPEITGRLKSYEPEMLQKYKSILMRKSQL